MTRVTSEQELALRDCLTGEAARFEMWARQPPSESLLYGLGVLSNTALAALAEQVFEPAWTPGDVVRYVAGLRIKYELEPEEMDPRAAEVLLLEALGRIDGPTAQVDEVKGRALGYLLLMIGQEAQMEGTVLEQFVADVRTRVEALAD